MQRRRPEPVRSMVKNSIAGADESTLAAQLIGPVRKYFIFLLLSSAWMAHYNWSNFHQIASNLIELLFFLMEKADDWCCLYYRDGRRGWNTRGQHNASWVHHVRYFCFWAILGTGKDCMQFCVQGSAWRILFLFKHRHGEMKIMQNTLVQFKFLLLFYIWAFW